MSLLYTERALHDLERLFEFVAEKDPDAAGRVGRQLLDSLERLAGQPGIGQALEGSDERPLRQQWVARDYVIRYRVRGDDVIVVRLWHGREAWRT